MFFNFISRFVSLELWENHSFLRRKLFFKKVFQKIISGENDFPPEKVPNCQISFYFFHPGNIPLKSGKDFLSKSNLTVWTLFGAGKILSRYNFSKNFFLEKNISGENNFHPRKKSKLSDFILFFHPGKRSSNFFHLRIWR